MQENCDRYINIDEDYEREDDEYGNPLENGDPEDTEEGSLEYGDADDTPEDRDPKDPSRDVDVDPEEEMGIEEGYELHNASHEQAEDLDTVSEDGDPDDGDQDDVAEDYDPHDHE